MRRMLAVAVLPLTCWVLAGCSGPCVHSYRDAVVHIAGAADSTTAVGIDSVFITTVTVDGDSLPLSLAVLGGGHESGVAVVGDTMRCRIPCSFGVREGRWQLTLSARGYPSQTRGFNAGYAVFHRGCPSYNDGGTYLALILHR
jgi:hypothetical protein